MKKIFLIFGILLNIFTTTGQQILIQELSVSPNGLDNVDIYLEVSRSDWFEYQNYIYEINTNIITLKVCYELYPAPGSNTVSKTFTIPITSPNAYILNLEIYGTYSSTTCDYTDLQNTSTLNFTTPLTATVYLGVEDLKALANKVTLYPNPVKGEVNIIKANDLTIHKLEVYTMLGSKIKTVRSQFERLDVTNFSDGLYFLTFHSNKGVFQKKIIISN